MAAITSDPSCIELSDDGTNEPESDVSCTSPSAAVAAARNFSKHKQNNMLGCGSLS